MIEALLSISVIVQLAILARICISKPKDDPPVLRQVEALAPVSEDVAQRPVARRPPHPKSLPATMEILDSHGRCIGRRPAGHPDLEVAEKEGLTVRG